MDNPEDESKISLVVGILGLITAVIFDLLSLIPFIGDIEEIPAGVVFILEVIFRLEKAVLLAQGTAMFIKAIPIIQVLPVWTVAWCVTWYVESHPSTLSEVIETVAEIESGEGGSVGEPPSPEGVQQVASSGAGVTAESRETAGAETSAATEDVELEAAATIRSETPLETPRETAQETEERAAEDQREGGPSHKSEDETREEIRIEEEEDNELERELETPEERSPEEVALERLFENMPTPTSDDEGEEPEVSKKNNAISPDAFARRAKELEVEHQQKILKTAGEVTDGHEIDDENEPRAA